MYSLLNLILSIFNEKYFLIESICNQKIH